MLNMHNYIMCSTNSYMIELGCFRTFEVHFELGIWFNILDFVASHLTHVMIIVVHFTCNLDFKKGWQTNFVWGLFACAWTISNQAPNWSAQDWSLLMGKGGGVCISWTCSCELAHVLGVLSPERGIHFYFGKLSELPKRNTMENEPWTQCFKINIKPHY